MRLNVLKAKIERNNLLTNAGKYFIDETSGTIKELNEQEKKALVGIQNKDKGVYTIIGEQFVYYLTSSGKCGKISHDEFIDALHENACRIGKGYLKFKFMYKNIVVNNKDKVWLHNANTMFSLWNTILWLQKQTP
ncbi:hypothetical protein [Flavobacterium oreochromis]|uniref:Uncharacterized protein n=1 Tax=Flavobacterium columnare TaxID=996 RepID=A0A246G6Z9_9FLAO|nr:hypothetical protein [Flavobacterium oreochromis]OWP74026.1 hypothetical protein BWK62_15230 [Flavobacterium oreochromis]POR22587.1 hypothetical protein BWK58_10890 [Flavobacterium columnare]QYS85977.1 hypothetical protein JJC03_13175 [Flavobacterium oreochromis]